MRDPRFIVAAVLAALLLFPLLLGAQTATWTDNSGGVASTNLYRAPTTSAGQCPAIGTVHPAPGYIKVGTAAPGVTTLKDATASQLQRYCYYVVAFGAVVGAPAGTIAESPASNTVTFDVPPKAPTLTVIVAVSISGPGAGGTVASLTEYADHRGEYEFTAAEDGTITLTATPKQNGSRFVGWSGPCSGKASTCVARAGDVVGAVFAR